MTFRMMTEADIQEIAVWYVDYFNHVEGNTYTLTTAAKRIRQAYHKEDAYCVVATDDGRVAAFVAGWFTQFDDGIVYDLYEIAVRRDAQRQGVGTALMREMEQRVKALGAILIQLTATNDDNHDRFYGRLGYGNATNNVLKSKMMHP